MMFCRQTHQQVATLRCRWSFKPQWDDVTILPVQLCRGGNLLEAISGVEGRKHPFTFLDVARLAICILKILDAMHTQGLAHCELCYPVFAVLCMVNVHRSRCLLGTVFVSNGNTCVHTTPFAEPSQETEDE
jgi:serine/threonine protein kinase